ncbi:MAG: HGxxPAAW family protein [Microbacterium sp.]|uniref:HGxxPAAW family protein n=1 Tax=Microbacterium sp. TaxID=51671 RepID=UPI003BAEAF67
MTNPIADPGHGHSPAAWTAVVIMLVGFTLGTVAYCLAVFSPVWVSLIWVGAAIVLVGAIVGWILAKAGYGVKGPKYSPKAH